MEKSAATLLKKMWQINDSKKKKLQLVEIILASYH